MSPSLFSCPIHKILVATGHLFDRSLLRPTEDYTAQLKENEECSSLLKKWKDKFRPSAHKPKSTLVVDMDGVVFPVALKAERLAGHKLPQTVRSLYPSLHPASYAVSRPNEVRAIVPTKGLFLLGLRISRPGYGILHPSTINAAVLQMYGVAKEIVRFDAVMSAPNFDINLKFSEAIAVARTLVCWQMEMPDDSAEMTATFWKPKKEMPLRQSTAHLCLHLALELLIGCRIGRPNR